MPNRADIPDGREYNKALAEEFRASGGKVSGDFKNRNVLLLTTTGAKSHEPHMTPLVYTVEGDRYLVAAAVGGAPKHPAWYFNLLAHPQVIVEVGAEKFEARAIVTEGDERAALFERRVGESPTLGEYQAHTSRVIPLILLERKSTL